MTVTVSPVSSVPFTAAAPHPEATELEALGERICEGAGHLAAATGAWLRLVEEFDRRLGWAAQGVRSCAHWLSWKCGIGLVAAREHVRVARALAELPRTTAELAAGRLSYSKARALTRVATAATEADLLQVALCSTGAQLEQLIAALRRAASLDDVNARHAARSLSHSWAEDGSLLVRIKLSPEDGALFLAGLDAARDTLPELDPDSEPRRTKAHANADAAVVMAETVLAAPPAQGGERHQVNIHADLSALLDDDVSAGTSPARIEGGPQLHPETLRRVLCDSATLIIAHHKAMGCHDDMHAHPRGHAHSTSMDVGRRTRVISAKLRRALFLRDHGCRFPGCTQKQFVDAHHVKHWSRGGPTAMHNLVLLCRFHHHAVHEGGFGLKTNGHGGFTFSRPDGVLIPEVPSPRGGDGDALPAQHGVSITAATAVPDWNGDRLDLDYAVSVLTTVPRHASAEAFYPAPPVGPALN